MANYKIQSLRQADGDAGLSASGAVTLKGDDRLLIEAGGQLAGTITWTGGGDVVVDNEGTVEAARILDVEKGASGSLVFNNLPGSLAKGAFIRTRPARRTRSSR